MKGLFDILVGFSFICQANVYVGWVEKSTSLYKLGQIIYITCVDVQSDFDVSELVDPTNQAQN